MKKAENTELQKKETSRNDRISNPDRRTFLAGSARAGILLLLGAFIGKLLFRKKIILPGDQRCINLSICSRCRIKTDCILPQAQSYRDVTGRGNA